MLNPSSSRGFTLVEVLVAVTILGILIAFSAPSLSAYMQSARLASAGSTVHAGLQSARAEAVRRNLPVQFVLTNDAVGTANIENSVIASATGRSWLIRAITNPVGPVYELVDAKDSVESSGRSSPAIAVSSNGPAGYAGAVTFGGFGTASIGVTPLTAPITIDLRTTSGEICVSAGGKMRCPRIRISPGGQVSNCDPVVTDVTDSRYCQP